MYYTGTWTLYGNTITLSLIAIVAWLSSPSLLHHFVVIIIIIFSTLFIVFMCVCVCLVCLVELV